MRNGKTRDPDKIVVLGVPEEAGLLDIISKAESFGLGAFAIHDAGRTEVEPGSLTVAAIGPSYEELVNVVTGHLRPYKEPKPIPVIPKPIGPVAVSGDIVD